MFWVRDRRKGAGKLGVYIIGEGVALALGQGATVIREEVCVCICAF